MNTDSRPRRWRDDAATRLAVNLARTLPPAPLRLENAALHWLGSSASILGGLIRRIERAEQLGYYDAAARLRERVAPALKVLGQRRRQFRERGMGPRRPLIARTPDLLKELRTLEAQFGALHIDADLSGISVTTIPIRLQDVRFGRFAIRLDLQSLRRGEQSVSSVLRLDALSPRPAPHHPGTTHPHVRDGVLSPGRFLEPLEAALETFRFATVMRLVSDRLVSYEPDMAFLPLDRWRRRRRRR